MARGWDEQSGRTSRAFDEWRLIETDQRAFLRLGLAFSATEYERLWRESGEEPSYEGGPDHLESFEGKVEGLHQQDFDWMHLSGVLRDSVTNFELYLGHARDELRQGNRHEASVSLRSPTWPELKTFFGRLDVEIETDGVTKVRDLRHFLTHQRGELRTEELREQFQVTHSEPIPSGTVALSPPSVVESMNLLAEVVRAIDPTVYDQMRRSGVTS